MSDAPSDTEPSSSYQQDLHLQTIKEVHRLEQEVASLRRKIFKAEQRAKHEQYMRRRYPAVEESYKQYLMMMKLVKNNKDNSQNNK